MTSLQPQSQTKYRLPTGIKPLHYDILIKTDLDKLEYQGIVAIK